MKHPFFTALLILIVSCTSGNLFASSPVDTIVLDRNLPNSRIDLAFFDKFGDYFSYKNKPIKEEILIIETPYLDVSASSAHRFWLRKGNYHIFAIGEEQCPKFETFLPADRIQDNEALFFIWFYQDNPDLKIGEKQKQDEIKTGVFHLKSEERYRQKLACLEKQGRTISPSFYDLCKKNFLVDYLSDLLYLYAREKREDIKQILLSYKEAIQFEDLLFSSSYRVFCKSYNLLIYLRSENDAYSRIKNNFSGKIRDYFLFELVKESESKELINTFLNDSQNEDYKNYIKQNFNIREEIFSAEDRLMQTNLSGISLKNVFSKYKGKVIYIDIWASWCGPCRRMLPKSRQLEEQFKNDVAFIYISIDKNAQHWIKAVQMEGLDEQNCYLISEKSNFIKEHEIQGIPHYMIFDRNGELINNDAMRPDDKDFVTKMNEIINEKNN